ncbi:hypothetical protein ACFXKX_35665 [Streptomyces scopuliridis]|uniref:hypothetical protein n=1 Tax=Streptomyces scopuliridis TaxID=452529 RepID=UPI0036B18975
MPNHRPLPTARALDAILTQVRQWETAASPAAEDGRRLLTQLRDHLSAALKATDTPTTAGARQAVASARAWLQTQPADPDAPTARELVMLAAAATAVQRYVRVRPSGNATRSEPMTERRFPRAALYANIPDGRDPVALVHRLRVLAADNNRPVSITEVDTGPQARPLRERLGWSRIAAVLDRQDQDAPEIELLVVSTPADLIGVPPGRSPAETDAARTRAEAELQAKGVTVIYLHNYRRPPQRRGSGRMVCGERIRLTPGYLHAAMDVRSDLDPVLWDITDTPRCALESHAAGTDHWGIARLLPLDGAHIWVVWWRPGHPHAVHQWPTCTATSPSGEPCDCPRAHHGGHSWQIIDCFRGLDSWHPLGAWPPQTDTTRLI